MVNKKNARVDLSQYRRLLQREPTLRAVGRKIRKAQGGRGVSRQRVLQVGQKYFPHLLSRFSKETKRQQWEMRKRQTPKDFATALVARRARAHGLFWEQIRVRGESGFRWRVLIINGERHFIVFVRQAPKSRGRLSYIYRSYRYAFLQQFEKMILVVNTGKRYRYFRFPAQTIIDSCKKRGLARVYIVLPLHVRFRKLRRGVLDVCSYENNWK